MTSFPDLRWIRKCHRISAVVGQGCVLIGDFLGQWPQFVRFAVHGHVHVTAGHHNGPASLHYTCLIVGERILIVRFHVFLECLATAFYEFPASGSEIVKSCEGMFCKSTNFYIRIWYRRKSIWKLQHFFTKLFFIMKMPKKSFSPAQDQTGSKWKKVEGLAHGQTTHLHCWCDGVNHSRDQSFWCLLDRFEQIVDGFLGGIRRFINCFMRRFRLVSKVAA